METLFGAGVSIRPGAPMNTMQMGTGEEQRVTASFQKERDLLCCIDLHSRGGNTVHCRLPSDSKLSLLNMRSNRSGMYSGYFVKIVII